MTSVALTPALARICAELTGDGHIQLMKHKNVGLISFYSKNYDEIKSFISRFQKIFPLKSHVYEDHRDGNTRYKLFFFSRAVADYLVSIGVPAGNKTNQVFFVPRWVLQGTTQIQCAYLRGLFTTEGSVSARRTNSGIRWTIEIEMYKWTKFKAEAKRFMEQVTHMLQDVDVHCSPVYFGRKNLRKDGTWSIATHVYIKKTSFNNFYKHVGFCNEAKQAKLAFICGGADGQHPCSFAEVSCISVRNSRAKSGKATACRAVI